MKDQFNTELSPLEEMMFNKWLAEKSSLDKRDVSLDLPEYDWRGWWKENSGELTKGGHVTDKYKKPQHPTFSNDSMYHGVAGAEGGIWRKDDKGEFFKPGRSNIPSRVKEYLKINNENVRMK